VCVNLEMIQWYEHYRDSGKCDMTHSRRFDPTAIPPTRRTLQTLDSVLRQAGFDLRLRNRLESSVYGVATSRQGLPFQDLAFRKPKSPHVISGGKHDSDLRHQCLANRTILPMFGSSVGSLVSRLDVLGPGRNGFYSERPGWIGRD
jgi:hypothetical protein